MPTATGQPIALLYGPQWATGQRLQYRTLSNTGNNNIEWSRVGQWALGEGEIDGLDELWDSVLKTRLYTSEFDDPTHFHFHRGCDATIGGGLAATSVGPDQGVDTFYSYLPAGVQPSCFNRIANYWWHYKMPVASPPNHNTGDPNNYTDLNPIGLWRGLRVRIFAVGGALSSYAYSTNLAWQVSDLILRRRLFPEFGIDILKGADDLPAAVRGCFDWPAWVDAAAWYDTINPNTGRKNVETGFTFTTGTTLQAMLSTMLQAGRSFLLRPNGKLQLRVDKNRASVFTVSRKNMLSFTATDQPLSQAASYTVALPAGYTLAQSICLAFVKDGSETGDNDAHGFSAWVDSAGVAHSLYQDNSGNSWTATNVRLFVFAWRNNMGTVTKDANGWWRTKLATGKTLAWVGADTYDAGLVGTAPPNHPSNLSLTAVPSGQITLAAGFNQTTLQTLTGPTSFQTVDHPTHGIRSCYITPILASQSSFEDGDGNFWYGTAGCFLLLCDLV